MKTEVGVQLLNCYIVGGCYLEAFVGGVCSGIETQTEPLCGSFFLTCCSLPAVTLLVLTACCVCVSECMLLTADGLASGDSKWSIMMIDERTV